MAQRRLSRFDNAIIAAITIVLLAFLGYELPVRTSKKFVCPYCSIHKTERSTLIGLTGKKAIYRKTNLSSYYAQNVDTNHKHTWLHLGTSTASLFRWISSSSSARPYSELVVRNEKAALAMLKSLPDQASRKAVMLRLCDLNRSGHNRTDRMMVDRVIEAYEENPNRKDWQRVLDFNSL